MPVIPQIAESYARLCNLSVDGSKYLPDTLESLVKITALAGRHITIRNADKMFPQTAEGLAKIGGALITLEI